MQFVIHAGTHKTATTPFQVLCGKNRRHLSQAGILYPLIQSDKGTSSQHSAYARDLSSIKPSLTKIHFDQHIEIAANLNLHTIFLSGEDFENILFDDNLVEKNP